jgi:hypothetical protein
MYCKKYLRKDASWAPQAPQVVVWRFVRAMACLATSDLNTSATSEDTHLCELYELLLSRWIQVVVWRLVSAIACFSWVHMENALLCFCAWGLGFSSCCDIAGFSPIYSRREEKKRGGKRQPVAESTCDHQGACYSLVRPCSRSLLVGLFTGDSLGSLKRPSS